MFEALNLSDAQFFRQPHFGFVENFFQAGKTGKGKAIDRNRADFADRRFFQRRTAAFFVNQRSTSGLPHDQSAKQLKMFRTAQADGRLESAADQSESSARDEAVHWRTVGSRRVK